MKGTETKLSRGETVKVHAKHLNMVIDFVRDNYIGYDLDIRLKNGVATLKLTIDENLVKRN